jgi:DNA-binding transcriptional LysR family regulator
MDRMASMAVFTKVVGTGSFSAAARELQLSQASVTKQVKELESWLGARLLNRTTRRLSLTEVGAGFYERSTRSVWQQQIISRYGRCCSLRSVAI